MKYRYLPTERFWKGFYSLSPAQKASARAKWALFQHDPFDARLGTHKIHRLSALEGRTVYAVVVEGDLRVAFYLEGDLVVSFAIGTHDIYKH